MHSTSPWQIIGASVTGTSHLKQGNGCDDTYMYQQHSNGTLMLAVADGAGSARHAALGAHMAVNAAMKAIEHILDQKNDQQDDLTSQDEWNLAIKKVLEDTHAEIQEYSLTAGSRTGAVGTVQTCGARHDPYSSTDPVPTIQQQDIPETISHPKHRYRTRVVAKAEEPQESVSIVQAPCLKDFATTLLIALVTPTWIVAAQIGDGAIIVHYDDQTVDILTQPNHGEYLNQTSFVTDPDYLQCAQITSMQHLPTVKGIALFTDGLENLALDFVTKAPYPPFFSPLFRFAARAESTQEELAAFLSSERVCKQTDDDKTILLAVRT